MSDEIKISQLELEMSVGAYEWEKQVKQSMFVDITLFSSTKAAGKSDDLADAVDYAEVAQRIKTLAQEQHFELIEFLAESIASRILTDSAVQQVQVSVTKPGAVAGAESVSVTITRPA